MDPGARANSVSPSYHLGTSESHYLWLAHYISLGPSYGPFNRPFTNVSIGCSFLHV